MMIISIGINLISNNQLRLNQYIFPQGNFKGGFRSFNNNRRRRIKGKNIQRRNNGNINNNIMDKKDEKNGI